VTVEGDVTKYYVTEVTRLREALRNLVNEIGKAWIDDDVIAEARLALQKVVTYERNKRAKCYDGTELGRYKKAYEDLVDLLEEYAEMEERKAISIGRPDITSQARTALSDAAREGGEE
jgi:hypothetical protein